MVALYKALPVTNVSQERNENNEISRHNIHVDTITIVQGRQIHNYVAKFNFDDFVTCEISLCTIYVNLCKHNTFSVA
jgi:hypothetical protein